MTTDGSSALSPTCARLYFVEFEYPPSAKLAQGISLGEISPSDMEYEGSVLYDRLAMETTEDDAASGGISIWAVSMDEEA